MAAPTQTPEVTIYAKSADPLTPVVVQYMNEHSGCSVTTKYIDQDASDASDDAEEGLKYPRIHVGSKYFGGVECLDKFPLKMTEHRMKEITGEVDEPMCREQKEFDRLILFNGKHEHEWDDMWKLYKQEIASYWSVEEANDLIIDCQHWEGLKPEERHFITYILAFFASLDVLVMQNISINFGSEIEVPQVQCHFAAQNAIESIHAEMYSLLIATYIKDGAERDNVLRSVQTMPIVRQKAAWVTRFMDPETVSLAERLIGFMCLEGIMFQGSFCAIFWLKSRGVMPGLCFANAQIAKDEKLHTEGSVLIYRKLECKLPEARVHEIVKDAVDVERDFITESLPASLIGMNAEEMSTYIKYVADFWLLRLGYAKLYNVANPFGWMEAISLQGKSSFFEVRVPEYARANVLADENEAEFALDVDF